MNGFREMNKQTDATPKVSTTSWSRDQKFSICYVLPELTLGPNKSDISDVRFREKKSQKTPFLVILGQKGPFWPVFGQNGQNGENYQKSAWNIFLAKNNERFPRKSVAYVRTDVRTDERTRLLRSQRPVGRETKNQQTVLRILLTSICFCF